MFWYSIALYHFDFTQITKSNPYFYNAFENSIFLAASVSLVSLVLSTVLYMSLLYNSSNMLYIFFSFSLIFFAALPSMVLLEALKKISLFNQLTPFWKSIITLSPQISSWILILLIAVLPFDKELSQQRLYDKIFGKNIFPFILEIFLPKTRKTLAAIFLASFILIFLREDIPSSVGLRSYGEYCLSEILTTDSPAGSMGVFAPILPIILLAWIIIQPLFIRPNKGLTKIAPSTSHNPKVSAKFHPVSLLLFIPIFIFFFFLAKLFIMATHSASLLNSSLPEEISKFIFTLLISTLTVFVSMTTVRVFQPGYTSSKTIRRFSSVMLALLLTPEMMQALGFSLFVVTNEFWQWCRFLFAETVYLLPPAWFLFRLELSSLNTHPSIEKHLPLTRIRRWFELTWPSGKTLITAEAFLLLIWSFTMLNIPLVLAPVGVETYTVRLYNLLHYGAADKVALAGLIEAGGILGLYLLILRSRK
jgi:ABC-type Fe3+ transport system permease subunit